MKKIDWLRAVQFFSKYSAKKWNSVQKVELNVKKKPVYEWQNMAGIFSRFCNKIVHIKLSISHYFTF
jgi:hypothetical protein